jgi:hypothetical protein
VGIGTTAPSAQLQLYTTSASSNRLNCLSIYSKQPGILLDATQSGTNYTWNMFSNISGSDNNLAFYTQGTGGYVMTMQASTGYVGISTTAPAYTLDVNGSARVSGNLYASGNVGIGITNPSTILQFNNTASQNIYTTFTISTPDIYEVGQYTGTTSYGRNIKIQAGNITNGGWGQSCYGGDLTIQAGNCASNGANNGSAPETERGGNVYIVGGYSYEPNGPNTSTYPGSIYLQTANTGYGVNSVKQRMCIQPNGRILLGNPDSYETLGEYNEAIGWGNIGTYGYAGITCSRGGSAGGTGYAGNLNFYTKKDSSVSYNLFQFNYSGQAYNPTGTWGSNSDICLKENIEDSRSYILDLCKLRVVKYSLKSDKLDKPNMIGLIAQEVEKIFPGLVHLDDTTNIRSVKYSIIIMMLLKTVQEFSTEITALKEQIAIILAKLA